MPPDPELLRCRSLLDCRHHHQAVDLYPNLRKNHFYTMYNPASYTVCEDHFPDKKHFALIDTRCLEFFYRISRSTRFDTHAEIAQVTHLHDVSFLQYIDDFEQELTDTTFQFSLE